MLWKRTQCSWKGGRFDRELMGRSDLAKYGEAASELENFIVKRTGAISKRRGSDELASLKNLLGYTVVNEEELDNEIDAVALIPIVFEKAKGYYILITSGRAYLIGEEGIKLADGTWTREIERYEYVEYSTGPLPYYCSVPYADGDLKEIDYCQSGDTIFIAHKSYPPASIVFDDEKLTFNELVFNNKTWYPPRILSVTASGTWGTTSSTKTVSYVATYVKDGIESEPSAEFQFSYKLPWGNTCRLEIKVDKGNNEVEPDYYNIYKKDSSQFGIISTIGSPVVINPTIPSMEGTVLYPNVTITGSSINAKSLSTYYKYNDAIFLGTLQAGEKVPHPNMIGGATTPNGVLTIDFGDASGLKITSLELQLDAFTSKTTKQSFSRGNRYTIHYYRYGSATYFTASAVFTDGSKTFTTEVSANAVLPDYTTKSFAAGSVSISNRNTYVTNPDIEGLNRSVTFNFLSFITGNTTLKDSQTWQIKSITVTFYDNSTSKTKVTSYFHGMRFTNALNNQDTFQDDYITPDMTVTPPAVTSHFDRSGDFPGCVAINQQRLCFASSSAEPFKMWMSCTGDLYNFDVHASIREDDALSFTLSATEFPEINHILECRNVMLFCDSGEWEVSPVSGNAITYKTVSAKMQSSLGCSKELKPIRIGDEIIFADRSATTLRATRYSFATDGYETNDLSVLSRDLTRGNPIVAYAYQQESDSLVWCVLKDGNLGVLVYMKEHEMVAWSRHRLGGGFKARGIASSKAIKDGTSDVVMLVERDGDWRIWRIRGDAGGRSAKDMVSMDGVRIIDMCVDPGEIGEDEKVVNLGNDVGAIGFPFTAKMVSVRPEADPKATVQYEIKNITELEARVIDSSSFSVKPYGVDEKYERTFRFEPEVVGEGSLELIDKDVRLTLFGSNSRDGRFELNHDGVWPLTVLSVSTTYQIELANEAPSQGGAR